MHNFSILRVRGIVWEVCVPLRRWTFSTVRTERGKRSGAHVLALNQSPKSESRQGHMAFKRIVMNTLMMFCAFWFLPAITEMKWGGSGEEKPGKTETCFDISLKKKKRYKSILPSGIQKMICEAEGERESLGSCFHGFACQQQRSHLGRETGQKPLCWLG